MRKSIETLKNIWNIEDLRKRILITILFVAIYRFGSYVVLPGINPDMLSKLHEQTSEGLLALLNMFSGGAFSNASIFALGIMPYISASIVIQLLAIAVPYFQKLQREGESGRRKINQYTRILTIIILIFQAPSYLINLKMQAGPALNASLDWTFFIITSTIILAAGSMFVLWLGERITDKGIGNGISLIIMVGIIARLPQSFSGEFVSRLASPGAGGIIMFLIELVCLLAVIAAAILLVQGVRKVPVQYAKRIVGNKQYGGARQYIPLKVNAANSERRSDQSHYSGNRGGHALVCPAHSAADDSAKVGFLSGKYGDTAGTDCTGSIIPAGECQGQAGADAGHFCRKAVPVLCPVPAGSDLAGIPHGKADRHSGDAGKCHHVQLFCHGEKYEA